MRLSLNNMKRRALVLEERIDLLEKALADVPEGSLRINKCRGVPQYYHKFAPGDTRGRYIASENRQLAEKLAQKDYDIRLLERSRDELKTLNVMIKKYEKGIGEDLFGQLNPCRQALITPVMVPDDEFVRQWLSQPYKGLGFDPGYPEIYNSSGLRVRSKSEMMISDKYNEFGIPSKYECPLYLEGYGFVYPDFTLLNVRLRKVFYHEHCGMMDDPPYADSNVDKIHAYERNGIIQGKNLILTFETKNRPLLPMDIELLIKEFLL